MLPNRIIIDVTPNGYSVKAQQIGNFDAVLTQAYHSCSDIESLQKFVRKSFEPARIKAKVSGVRQKDEAYQPVPKGRHPRRKATGNEC